MDKEAVTVEVEDQLLTEVSDPMNVIIMKNLGTLPKIVRLTRRAETEEKQGNGILLMAYKDIIPEYDIIWYLDNGSRNRLDSIIS